MQVILHVGVKCPSGILHAAVRYLACGCKISCMRV